MRRYRRPKVSTGQIKLQKGKHEGDVGMLVYFGDSIPRCDRVLMMNALCSERPNYKNELQPSLIDELEARGYDIDTLRFSIEKNNQTNKEGS